MKEAPHGLHNSSSGALIDQSSTTDSDATAATTRSTITSQDATTVTAGPGATPVAREVRPREAAPPARMLLAQTAMELRLTLRRGESVLITLVVPALLLVFFATVAVLPAPEGDAPPASPVDVLMLGVLALAIMSTSMVSLGIATAFERQYGVLKRLGGSPLPRPAL